MLEVVTSIAVFNTLFFLISELFLLQLAVSEVTARFQRQAVTALQLQRQRLYWRIWQNDTIKGRVREGATVVERDYAFSTNFHVTLRALAADAAAAYLHHVVVSLEARQKKPVVIGVCCFLCITAALC